MAFLLPLGAVLTAAITVKTIDKTSKKMIKRRKRSAKKDI